LRKTNCFRSTQFGKTPAAAADVDMARRDLELRQQMRKLKLQVPAGRPARENQPIQRGIGNVMHEVPDSLPIEKTLETHGRQGVAARGVGDSGFRCYDDI
jgi:hypothetical protein